ncbi:MAG TPA: hypothetical protein VFA74_11580 [Terriglobales bacterium]|nr:hypothetical protein [Terriglobales bacterium]
MGNILQSQSTSSQIKAATRKPVRRWLSFFAPSVADILFVTLLLALSCGALGRLLLRDADTGWHIRNGQLILQTHTITRTDPFSSTMSGQLWYAWEWLYDVFIAIIHRALGLNGVVFFTAALIASVFVLVLHLAMRRGGTLFVSIAFVLLALVASTIHFLARPHILSWLFAVIWFDLLDSASTGKDDRRIFWLPALMVLWVNLHGGFLLGFVLLGIYLAGGAIEYSAFTEDREATLKWLRRVGLITALSFAASLLNPFDYRLYIHVYQYLSNSFLMNHIAEFLSANFHSGAALGFVMLLLISILVLTRTRQSIRVPQFLVILFAIFSGLYAARNLPISAILAALIMAPIASQTIIEAGSDPKLMPWTQNLFSRVHAFGERMANLELHFRSHLWLILAFALGLGICANGGRLGTQQFIRAYFDAKVFPVEAVDVIAQRKIWEPIFCPDSWGGYLIYKLYPQTKVVVDDRHDLYGDAFLKDYIKVIQVEPEWRTVLDTKHVNWVLMPANSALATVMRITPQWAVAHEDKTAILFQRSERQ